MKPILCVVAAVLLAPFFAVAQAPEPKFIADTLVVQAEGTYESGPRPCDYDVQDFLPREGA